MFFLIFPAITKQDADQTSLSPSVTLLSVLRPQSSEERKTKTYFISEHSFLLTEYCSKGSLQDILEDDAFELDMDFK